MKILFMALCLIISINVLQAQTPSDSLRIDRRTYDSLYIAEIEHPENKKLKDKVLHAEPLYIDLIRDLGARKGEKEWNIGMGFTDMLKYDRYEALIEYEFAPIDRLGLEVEIPFSFYLPLDGMPADSTPSHRIESLKLAAQYSFFVSEKWKTSLAIGYINELELVDIRRMGKDKFLTGNLFNPFFIAAKRWGNRFHTLIYTGPRFLLEFHDLSWHIDGEFHTNFHYMIPGTRNFIGIEVNKYFNSRYFDMTIRPQMRVGLADNFLVGVVAGIPIDRTQERLSAFVRLIYEPGHRIHKKKKSNSQYREKIKH
ncbi:MAG: phosphoribosylformylglycinamidine synthase [Candidatus Competibacteraceae bacterium]|nr:phosphoribosylformylglycinamidine synthase [Candidatus Competibacteraceae bacterium]